MYVYMYVYIYKHVHIHIYGYIIVYIHLCCQFSFYNIKDHASVLINGTCQIPDPVYKLIGSIVCFYIPLAVMLLTYYLTVRLLAKQRENLGGASALGWASGWLGQAPAPGKYSTYTYQVLAYRKFLRLVTCTQAGIIFGTKRMLGDKLRILKGKIKTKNN